jgi:hypothetical protein
MESWVDHTATCCPSGARVLGRVATKWWPSAATATTLSRTRDKHWRSGQETSGSPPTHLSLATQYFSCLICTDRFAHSVRDVSVSTARSSAGTAPNTPYRNDHPCPPRTHKACKTHIVRLWLARLSSSYHCARVGECHPHGHAFACGLPSPPPSSLFSHCTAHAHTPKVNLGTHSRDTSIALTTLPFVE